MVKLSIVIPYYETYELTDRLVRCLVSQLEKEEEIEIIIVDDGCNETRLNERFGNIECVKIIHQENTGVAGARNKGIELAQGEYIAFIDSDDMIMPYYVETLIDLINTRNEDIFVFDWLDKNTNDVIKHPDNCAVWKAIYKKEILPKFKECYKAGEDYFFSVELEKGNYTRYYCDMILYIYNSGRENSLTWKNERGLL